MSTAPDSLITWAHGGLRMGGRLLARTAVRLALFGLLALIATWPLLASAGSLNGYRDSHPLVQYEESARQSLLGFGQLPLWDPYYCGGMDGLGTPQSRFVSPTFLLTLLFGTLRGEPLVAFFMMWLGLEGAYRYARSRRASALGAGLAAPLFAVSGFFAVLPALGWYNFFGFELLPWAAFGLRRAMRGSYAGVAIAAAALAWMVGFGGTYPAPMAALWCAFEAACVLGALRKDAAGLRRALAMGALTAVLAVALSAVKLWPVAQTMAMAPRIIGGTPGTGTRGILRALLARIHPDEHGDFPIGGTFLVGGFAALAVGAAVPQRRAFPLVVAGAATIWLAAGFAPKVSLFAALKHLPLYATLRYPERFLVVFAMVASALAALGITRLQVLARRRALGVSGLLLAGGLLLANLGPLVLNQHAAARGRPMVAPPPEIPRDFHQARGTRWALAYYGPASRGTLSCYDAYPVPQSPLLRADLREEEYVDDATAGTARRQSFSPNLLKVEVELTRPARLMINQNWHPGWRTNVGEVTQVQGLLAVALPAGKHVVDLSFRPRAAIGGVMVSLTALLVLAWLVVRERRATPPAPRLVAMASLAPVAVFGLALLLLHEPKVPRAEPRTPAGELVVADALPPGTAQIDAHFDGGLTLVGYRQSTNAPRAESVMTLELDWRIEPGTAIDKRLGIFVHIVPSSGDDLRADHVFVSDVLPLEDAPTGRILRDVIELSIPHDAGGKTWTVHTGVWRVRGNGKRVEVKDPGRATVADHRLQLGRFVVP